MENPLQPMDESGGGVDAKRALEEHEQMGSAPHRPRLLRDSSGDPEGSGLEAMDERTVGSCGGARVEAGAGSTREPGADMEIAADSCAGARAGAGAGSARESGDAAGSRQGAHVEAGTGNVREPGSSVEGADAGVSAVEAMQQAADRLETA
eukprot:4835008-Lingulodinium_polyedra.AAC.1